MTSIRADEHEGHPIVLVDGVCHFCQGLTKWIIKRDPEGKYHFASLQSDVAKDLLKKSVYRQHGYVCTYRKWPLLYTFDSCTAAGQRSEISVSIIICLYYCAQIHS